MSTNNKLSSHSLQIFKIKNEYNDKIKYYEKEGSLLQKRLVLKYINITIIGTKQYVQYSRAIIKTIPRQHLKVNQLKL